MHRLHLGEIWIEPFQRPHGQQLAVAAQAEEPHRWIHQLLNVHRVGVFGRCLAPREHQMDLEQPAHVRSARIVGRDLAVLHRQRLDTVTLDITTAGVGVPSPCGVVGSEPIFSTTSIPETTLPAHAAFQVAGQRQIPVVKQQLD